MHGVKIANDVALVRSIDENIVGLNVAVYETQAVEVHQAGRNVAQTRGDGDAADGSGIEHVGKCAVVAVEDETGHEVVIDDDAVVETCVCVWVLAQDFTRLDFSCCDVAEPGRVEETGTKLRRSSFFVYVVG
jgi:hypothetical protein